VDTEDLGVPADGSCAVLGFTLFGHTLARAVLGATDAAARYFGGSGAQWDAASRYVDTQLEQRVARLAFGDSTARRRTLKYDAPLRKALEVMNRGQTQKDLFAIATAEAAAHPEAVRATRKP
jgi:hypothetical protein